MKVICDKAKGCTIKSYDDDCPHRVEHEENEECEYAYCQESAVHHCSVRCGVTPDQDTVS